MPPQIFISYSHTDSAFATRLAKDLKEQGYHIWLDRTDIQTGSRWDDEIVRGLDSSQVFLVLLSTVASESQNVKDEIGYALDHGKRIMPLLIEPCEIPFRLRRIQYVDFTSTRYEDGIKSVVEILGSILPGREAGRKKTERKAIDPAVLATTATDLLIPLLAQAGESGLEALRAKLPDHVSRLWDEIFARFEGNPAASGTASDLARDAQNPDHRGAFAIQLKKVLKKDPDFAFVLSDLMDQARAGIESEDDRADATPKAILVSKIQVGGDFKGNITIGNNNKVG